MTSSVFPGSGGPPRKNILSVDGKTNEIPAAQELLKLMDLKGTIVTASALNCQKDTVSVLNLVKESYKLSMKRIRYELSLD